jgi:protein-L-isoaspartate O-methyltransferase
MARLSPTLTCQAQAQRAQRALDDHAAVLCADLVTTHPAAPVALEIVVHADHERVPPALLSTLAEHELGVVRTEWTGAGEHLHVEAI